MRLAAQAKMGYYPVTPATIDYVCRHITLTDPTKTFILDPCCGAGAALGQFGTTLGIPKDNLYGIELDKGRAEKAEAVANVLNASFFGTRIVPVQAFSLLWLNPPYENEVNEQDRGLKGMSLERQFLKASSHLVAKKGIAIMHCPENRLAQVELTFCSMYEDCRKITLPEGMRPYGESLLIGTRKSNDDSYYHSEFTEEMPAMKLPAGRLVRKMTQITPTDEQIQTTIETSRLLDMFKSTKKPAAMRPLQPLGPGHLGLTLASGMLDGLFCPPGYEPHVVRGIAFKTNELASSETTVDDDGNATTTETYRENIRLKIRLITMSGEIQEKQ